MELLTQFREQSIRLAFVVDEYGVVQGLLTPRDLLEAITGELQSGTPADAWATQRDDGSWLLDGLMPVSELKDRLQIDELPDEDRRRYNTLAGLLMAVSGHLPVTGEAIVCVGWRFEVVDLDGKRIDKVLASSVQNEHPRCAAGGGGHLTPNVPQFSNGHWQAIKQLQTRNLKKNWLLALVKTGV